MDNWSPNPYFHMATIRTTNMFFGRRNLLRRFYEAIVNHQSVSLVGPRHIGKSSFLWCVGLPEIQEQFPFDLRRHIFVPLDLREYLYKTSNDFFQNVSKEIILQSRKIPDLTLKTKGRGEEAFSFILDRIEEQGFYPVLLLDAFDNVTLNKQFGPEFFSFLRAHATMGQVSYVTATIAPLYELCHRGIVDSPFFNIFYNYTLEALTQEEAQELIRVPAQKAGIPFTEEEVAWVVKMAGRHPFFIQRVSHILLDEKMQREKCEVDMQLVRNLAYKDLKPHFQDTWDRLTEEQQALLTDEAQQKDRQHRELPELSESAFFRQFVRNTCRVGLFTISAEELEHALDKIGDPRALGETDLRLMKTVSRRFSNENATSTVERGMAVREVLNEAFGRLRGPDVRSDSGPGWLLYNILYYRYFKYHMKNEQIAARLGIPNMRQYYRHRNKAIKALLDILFEMEKGYNSVEE
jgi:hypothetical protein